MGITLIEAITICRFIFSNIFKNRVGGIEYLSKITARFSCRRKTDRLINMYFINL